jgi:hypothetical protein
MWVLKSALNRTVLVISRTEPSDCVATATAVVLLHFPLYRSPWGWFTMKAIGLKYFFFCGLFNDDDSIEKIQRGDWILRNRNYILKESVSLKTDTHFGHCSSYRFGYHRKTMFRKLVDSLSVMKLKFETYSVRPIRCMYVCMRGGP